MGWCRSASCPGGECPGIENTHKAAGLGQQRGSGVAEVGRRRTGCVSSRSLGLLRSLVRNQAPVGAASTSPGPYLPVHQQADGQRHVQATFRDFGLHLSSKMQLGVVAQGAGGAVRKDRWGPDGVTWRGRAHVRGRVCATGSGRGWAMASCTIGGERQGSEQRDPGHPATRGREGHPGTRAVGPAGTAGTW